MCKYCELNKKDENEICGEDFPQSREGFYITMIKTDDAIIIRNNNNVEKSNGFFIKESIIDGCHYYDEYIKIYYCPYCGRKLE